MNLGRDLFDAYEGSLMCEMRFISGPDPYDPHMIKFLEEITSPIKPRALAFKAAMCYRSDEPGWALQIIADNGESFCWLDSEAYE